MERNIQNIRDNVSKAIDDNKPEATPQQWLLYAGAAGAAAGAAALTLNPEGVEKMYGNDTPTMTGSVGRKYRHLTALQMAGHSALQALAAHEKPSSRMLAVNGGLWAAGSVLTGAHTFHTKSLKKETGLALGGAQLAIGAAMIGRAIYMERNNI